MKVRALLNIDNQQMHKRDTDVIQFFLVLSKHEKMTQAIVTIYRNYLIL